ncbi:MAG TPA: gamma-glutamyltransferase [Terrimesophilobacter sp.]|uniref:gamma-glutamyltransferase n=1 Tax=Terrimesophilobacter sp. TaxID=2906435 RepID=UPI002F9503FB
MTEEFPPARIRHSRPVSGERGAISAAHPLAVSAGVRMLEQGGSALDAAIAAQAVICVTMPHAAGLGGDLLALVHLDGIVTAVNGTGRSAMVPPARYATDGGSSVTVPGLVDGWIASHARWGRLPLEEVLAPAAGLAERGFPVDGALAAAVTAQRSRISHYGGADWSLLGLREGDRWRQPELAALLRSIPESGAGAFYSGSAATAIASAVARTGGTLSESDLANQASELLSAAATAWGDQRLYVQPPATQGILLAMAARWLDAAGDTSGDNLDHLMVEATEAAFGYRDDVAVRDDLLDIELQVDRERAGRRGGPRAYLHTAGVAAADADGMVVSSLVSVFDDFGSGVFVPELGIVLGNRAAGFTGGENAAGPGKRPVHTLAPSMLIGPGGEVIALATPGADGQVQTLLQVLSRLRFGERSLDEALAAPRWRSEGGSLLIEADHQERQALADLGHRVTDRKSGDDVFGAVVAAGLKNNTPYAAADWRRNVTTGAV